MGVFIILVFLAFVTGSQGWTTTDETSLRTYLSGLNGGYQSKVRPSDVTAVTLTFYICGIDGADLKTETFSVSGWWHIQWSDSSRLTWTPASYNNIQLLIYHQEEVWWPSIVVLNSGNDLSAINDKTIPLRVSHTGTVEWQPPALLNLGCSMDNTYYPFDSQSCSINVMPFGYSSSELTINTTDGVQFDFYTMSGEWEVKATSAMMSQASYRGRDNTMVTFTFHLSRRSSVYWLSVVIPVVVNAYLMMMVFLLPAASGEKMGYSLTCLLTYVVILTIITQEMSNSATSTSLLEVYIVLILVMAAVSVILATLNLEWFNRPEGQTVQGFHLKLATLCLAIDKQTCGKRTAEAKIKPEDPRPDKSTANVEEVELERKLKQMTYQTFAEVVDIFFFRVYLVLITVLTVIFMLVLGCNN